MLQNKYMWTKRRYQYEAFITMRAYSLLLFIIITTGISSSTYAQYPEVIQFFASTVNSPKTAKVRSLCIELLRPPSKLKVNYTLLTPESTPHHVDPDYLQNFSNLLLDINQNVASLMSVEIK